MSARAGGALWRFSLALWAQPPVVRACLALQDKHGADVNLVLWCCWLASRGQRLDRRKLACVMHVVGRWQAQVVRPLRAARRALTQPLPAIDDAARARLRHRAADLELGAERLEQTLLEHHAARLPAAKRPLPVAAAARASLGRYLAALGVPEGAAEAEVEALVSALPGATAPARAPADGPRRGPRHRPRAAQG